MLLKLEISDGLINFVLAPGGRKDVRPWESGCALMGHLIGSYSDFLTMEGFKGFVEVVSALYLSIFIARGIMNHNP